MCLSGDIYLCSSTGISTEYRFVVNMSWKSRFYLLYFRIGEIQSWRAIAISHYWYIFLVLVKYWQIFIYHHSIRSHNSIMLYFPSIFCILLYILSIFSVFLSILLVSVEYWQICIYPLRVAQWHSRARYLAQDGQLRSSSHQQFYKTQFIKNFWISQFLS